MKDAFFSLLWISRPCLPIRALQVWSDEGCCTVREWWREHPLLPSPWEDGLPGGEGRCKYPPHILLLRLRFPCKRRSLMGLVKSAQGAMAQSSPAESPPSSGSQALTAPCAPRTQKADVDFEGDSDLAPGRPSIKLLGNYSARPCHPRDRGEPASHGGGR